MITPGMAVRQFTVLEAVPTDVGTIPAWVVRDGATGQQLVISERRLLRWLRRAAS